MAKITPVHVTEHFVRDLKESFWGDLYSRTRLAWKRFWEEESLRERDTYMKTGWKDRVPVQAGWNTVTASTNGSSGERPM